MDIPDNIIEKTNQIIFSILFLVLPIFKLSGFGGWFARLPQFWLWVSGILLLFALSQKNVWLTWFLIYCLIISIYHDFIVGNVAFYNADKIIIRDFILNKSLYVLAVLCLTFWTIILVQKLNEDWLKVCILFVSSIVLVFWIINDFVIKNALGEIAYKENKWIAGAFLAFALPYILTVSKNNILNYLTVVIFTLGVLCTKSTMAILAALGGVSYYFICHCKIKNLLIFVLFVLVGLTISLPKIFKTNDWKKIGIQITENSFRKDLWYKSFKYKKEEGRKPTTKRTLLDQIIGTGLRSYFSYGFLEGVDTLTTHAHNEFLEVWCELGWVGLLLVIGFIINLYYIPCPIEYKASLTAIIIHCIGYYAARLALTGFLIIITIGLILKYQGGEINDKKTIT